MTQPSPFATLHAIRSRAPLVHNITNLVVTNTTANALLAVGASPAMVEGADEAEEFARLADALVVNLGTMSSDRAAAIRLAAAAAQMELLDALHLMDEPILSARARLSAA